MESYHHHHHLYRSNITYPYVMYYATLFILLTIVFISTTEAQTPRTRHNSSITAAFVFGDSTVDPGNNNYVNTLFKSNFAPYGRDFVNHIPTGRFTNGRLVTDFAASYVGIKEYVPPYLDPTLSIEELMTGVSFASAGSGFDPLTSTISSVISIKKQVEYFKEYKARIEVAIGKERTQNLIKNAVYVTSAGTNDYVVNYFGTPIRRQSYSISSYQQFLIQHIQQFIQDLLDLGARMIVMVGVPPIGCLPMVITLNSHHLDAFHKRECIDSLSSVAMDHNRILQQKLKDMQTSSGTEIYYTDIYKSFMDIIQYHKTFGFDEVNTGCCGSGLIEATILCNSGSALCSDTSKYVFFDSIHPTERAYYIIFKSLSSIIDRILKER